jgi:nitroreductase
LGVKAAAKRLVAAWRRWREGRKAKREARAAFRYDWRQFKTHAGALHLDGEEAARAAIVMGYHVLEKGLTMPRRRMGFGKGAALHLANLVEEYERRFGTGDGQVRHAVAVLRAYRELHRDWPEPMPRLDAFLAERGDVAAAVEPHVRREAFFAAKNAPFPAFAASRHMVRHFAGAAKREALEEAIRLAATAPSSCNRQPVRVHVVENRAQMERLLAMQGGTRGFGGDAGHVLLVTAERSTVRWGWERNDMWVNGGIFAMNLCYALHWEGIAHCLLHWSVPPGADREAHRLLGIPEREGIVALVACGMPPEEFDVAASPRRGVEELATWHS